MRPIRQISRAICLVLVTGLSGYLVAPSHALAPGTIYGSVTDAQTGEPLTGATVRIDGTSIGAATDLNGEYRIPRVPEGAMELIVSYVGYEQKRVSVTLASGENMEVNVALGLDVLEGQEIVISAQAEGQVAAINQQLASNQIVSVVSDARIQELPDANAAESVGRLAGISIQRDAGEGQKVVIRGLSPKYNNVTVNGVKLPATDFENRSTDLNMVAPEMLAGIEVFKALTPDQDADAIGGSVNFRLRGAPKGFRANAVFQTGYNTMSEGVGQYKGNLTLSNRFFNNKLGIFGQGNLERADRNSERVNADFINQARSSIDTSRVLLTEDIQVRDRVETRDRYGASLLLDYKLPMGTLQLTNFFNRLNRDFVTRENLYSTAIVSTSYDVRDTEMQTDVWSVALSGEFKLADLGVLDFNLSRSTSLLDKPFDNRLRFTQNAAFDTGNLVRDKGPEIVPTFVERDLNDTFLDRTDFFLQEMQEEDRTARANLQLNYTLGSNLTGFVKVGGKYARKHRENDNTQYWYQLFFSGVNGGLDELVALFPDAARTSGGQIGLASFLEDDDLERGLLDDSFTFYYPGSRSLANSIHDALFPIMNRAAWGDFADYGSDEDVAAGYIMSEINIGPRIMILPGVRYEHTRTAFDAFFGRAPSTFADDDNLSIRLRDTTSTQNYDGWFPMVQARIRPTDWFDIRLAYTETQSRPEFTFISPSIRISDATQRIDKGTPDLRPSRSQNIDAYVSFYSNRIGLFSAGGFFKKIDGVIYDADIVLQDRATAAAYNFPEFTGYTINAPMNLEEPTYVRGLELDWQANLLWLPGPLSGIVFNANYARIFSETQIERLSAKTVAEPPFYIPKTTYSTYYVTLGMLDQPDHVANVSLGYDKGKFSGRVSFLYQEGNLTSYGSNDGNVAFFDTYTRWDAQISYRLLPSLTVYSQLNNLTDRPDTSVQSTARFLRNQEFYGSSFNLGLRYRPF